MFKRRRVSDESAAHTAGRALGGVEAKIDILIEVVRTHTNLMRKKMNQYQQELDDFREELARNRSLDESALAALAGLAQKLDNIAGASDSDGKGIDPQVLRDFASELRAQNDRFGEALKANTEDEKNVDEDGNVIPQPGTPGTDFDPNRPSGVPKEQVVPPGQPQTTYPDGTQPEPFPNEGFNRNPDMSRPSVETQPQPVYPVDEEDSQSAHAPGEQHPADEDNSATRSPPSDAKANRTRKR